MSDDLPPPPPLPDGFEFPLPPPPTDDVENKVDAEELDQSSEDIRKSVDNLISNSPSPSNVAESIPESSDLEVTPLPPPLPPGLEIPPPPPLPPGLEIPPLPPGLDITTSSPNSTEPSPSPISESVDSVNTVNLDTPKSLSDNLSVFNPSHPARSSNDSDIWEKEETVVNSISEVNSVSNALDSLSPQPISVSESSHHLRPSIEVDVIPGDKLHVILSEVEESLINPDGSSIKQTIEGELILKNPSKKHRAWDIEIELSNTDATDLGGKTVTVR
ncbi:MAG: hypothetical protein OR994_05830, partial [Candidatus Poseidoniales archaeon]|nr:hypothetical protein [Candidatus Poseidoniales archaeon]